jgi:hypothetical protein
MSWSSIFPVFFEEAGFCNLSRTFATQQNADCNWFCIDNKFGKSGGGHLLVFSLFWKNSNLSEPDVPKMTREMLRTMPQNTMLRFSPWEHYIQPLLDAAAHLKNKRPEVAIRIYLAADLSFLIPDFTALGCEICLMKSSSIRHNPGAMWRFLALEEKGRLVTFADADRAMQVEADIAMTEEMARLGLKFWRVPVFQELNSVGQYNYRPIRASGFGSNLTLPAGDLMKALIWATQNGTISTKCRPPGEPEYTIFGTQWPDYGFDEWFLQAAVYPRVAQEGILTLVPSTVRSKILPLDIEYCTWANPNSEVCYFGVDDTMNQQKSARSQPGASLPIGKAPSALTDRRKKWRRGQRESTGQLAGLIFLPAAEDGPEARQMVTLLVASLLATEFAGEILIWRESGTAVIAGGNAAEVQERLGTWSDGTGVEKRSKPGVGKRLKKEGEREPKKKHEMGMKGAKGKVWADPELAGFARVLLLGPGALACRNVEYLLEPKTGWRTLAGLGWEASPVTAGRPWGHAIPEKTPSAAAQPVRRQSKGEREAIAKQQQQQVSVPVAKAFERGAVEVWDFAGKGNGRDNESSSKDERSAAEVIAAGTLLWVTAADAATQLQGVWQAWLARFAPEQAAVLSPMVALESGRPAGKNGDAGTAGEHTRPACREGRPALHLKPTRRSRTSKET